jgi:hypothetical protein
MPIGPSAGWLIRQDDVSLPINFIRFRRQGLARLSTGRVFSVPDDCCPGRGQMKGGPDTVDGEAKLRGDFDGHDILVKRKSP